MRALEVVAPNEVIIAEKAIPEPGPGEVRIRVHWAGVCGTDYSLVAGKLTFARYPVTPGHEFSGRVSGVGPGVDIPLGQAVTVNPVLSCQRCEACLKGEVHHCTETAVLGVAGVAGGFADHVVVPAYAVRRLPDDLGLEAGAVAEPTAVAVRVARRAGIGPGDRVAVLGAGNIGLFVLEVAFALGAASVSVTDLVPERVEIACHLGGKELDPEAGAGQYEVVIDGVGSAETLETACRLAGRGGKIVVYGVPHEERMSLPVLEMFRKDLSLILCRLYAADWNEAITLLSEGRVNWRKIVTPPVSLEALPDAIASVMQDPSRGVKILARISEEGEV